jgi:hypothetical protein
VNPFLILTRELRELFRVNPSTRPWQMPLIAALVTGLPLLVGAAMGNIALGVAAALGTFVFLYVPDAPLARRMRVLGGCALAMCASYALGLLAGHWRVSAAPFVGVLAVGLTMAARRVRLNPPAGLFFVMAAAIGIYADAPLSAIPLRVGLLAVGAGLAVLAGLAYARLVPPSAASRLPPPPLSREALWVDPVIIGIAVAISLGLAQALGIERPYWAPVSCLAVIQGASLRAIWTRQAHRMAGTVLGLGLAAAIFSLPLGPWSVAVAITGLCLVIEIAVVRHYGFAIMFVTPMSILLAEAPRLGAVPPGALMEARLFDTVIGSAVGLAFGFAIHHTRIKAVLRRAMGLTE